MQPEKTIPQNILPQIFAGFEKYKNAQKMSVVCRENKKMSQLQCYCKRKGASIYYVTGFSSLFDPLPS